MVDKSKVVEIVREHLDDGMFLVDATVSSLNVIHIYIDSFNGLKINDCAVMSRHIEDKLDSNREDYELYVSSPGLSRPFKVKEQYYKNIGREITVITNNGTELKGILKEAGPGNILLETSYQGKVNGHKKKKMVFRDYNMDYNEIKSAKVIVTFK
jgi:ribosome maturation factor RimP